MPQQECLFCDRDNSEKHTIIAENELFYARWDNFAVTQGHLEVVSKRHIISFFDLTEEDMKQMFELLQRAKDIVEEKFSPDAYNIGLNDGEAAGRTIHHFHIHLIPRYFGDVENPRGGVRNIIPEKGDYQETELGERYTQNCLCQNYPTHIADDCHVHNENPRHFAGDASLSCDCF